MKYFRFLFSGWFMGLLLIVFAYAIGYATFVENDFGPVTARYTVYNARWFEVLMLLMIINFSGMIFTKHLYLRSKWNILVIHVALVIIIIGAGVTRYFGYEGQMHIRNGQTTNVFRSSDTYVRGQLTVNDEATYFESKVLLPQKVNNFFDRDYTWKGKDVNLKLVEYMPNASEVLVPAEDGAAYINMILGSSTGRIELRLKEGESRYMKDFGISFNDTTQTDNIQIILQEGQLYVKLPEPMRVSSMNMEGEETTDEISDFHPIMPMTVQTMGDVSFVIKDFVEHGKVEFQPAQEANQQGTDVVRVQVNGNDAVIPVNKETNIPFEGGILRLSVGFKSLELPFALKLKNFDLERYPGSMSPSSYASDVVLIDEAKGVNMPFRIYMNHILNYGGYRFFQSSYDQDEQGTILSVNKDYWGTLISYIGYALLFGSMLLSLFIKGNRFDRVTKMLQDIHTKRKKVMKAATIIGLAMLVNTGAFAQSQDLASHADKFGYLYVQSNEGRIEPVNTLANKILVKISKKASYEGLSANEVLLGMVTDQSRWQQEKLIKVPEKEVQALLGIVGDHASFLDFIDQEGQYKIRSYVEEAYRKKPVSRSTLDKALINVDDRVNVFYMVLNGSMLKIFPVQDDPNNKWATPQEHHQVAGHGTEEGDLFENYLKTLQEAKSTNNYSGADATLDVIIKYQKQHGSNVMPSAIKAKMEVFYNETNIFKTLFPVYLLIGMLLVAIFMIQIFYPNLEFKMLAKILLVIMVIAFAIQTVGLGIRWYITGHAPWSNGYESMIYISWATVLAGFVFMKRSPVTLGVTALLAGITLLTAHMSWLNPELTNLVPVLKSYWLTIHVATITGSYGFLALGCMIGFLNMVIMIFRNEKNKERINLTLRELMLIIELSLSAGLVLLIIGNFLGGIWANESWGRYWGWDPKETWTLVTVILYAFTLHTTLIPAIRNTFTFSFFSFASFGAVLMTYFGVNYYLSGLHSYANGDPVAIPSGVYYGLGVIAIVSILAAYNDFKFNEDKG